MGQFSSIVRGVFCGLGLMSALALFDPFLVVDASATTLYSQSFVPNDASTADADASIYQFDDFTLSADSVVGSLSWMGFYYSTGTPPVTDNFTLEIYSDVGGTLGPLLAQYLLGNDVSRNGTGQIYFRNTEWFSYSALVPGGLALSAGNYWIAIFNNTIPDTNDSWYWARQSNLNDPGFMKISGTTYSTPYPSLYSLEGNTIVTPLPAGLPLLAAGLGAMGFMGWRKKRKVVQ